jgi:hypothetical protein
MINKLRSVHRWEDVASILLGVAAAIAAVFFHPALDAILINGAIAGLVIIALAVMEITMPPRWEEPLEIAAGIWLMASPFSFGYGDPLRIVHVVIGALVAILAAIELWQDRENIEASP